MEEIVQSAQWKAGTRSKVRNRAQAPSTGMAETPRDDQELLRQLAKGNEAAFREMYERYQGRIFRFALHMSGNRATAEEVTQEVFTLLISSPRDYRPDRGPVSGYLFGIARNLAKRRFQRQQFDVPLDDDDSLDADPAGTSDLNALEELSQTELLECLRQAITSLPEQYREAVVLCDLEEMSYADAGEVLGCPAGTVASRLHRARAMLKTKLSKSSNATKLSGQQCAK